jgi:hypothetical protein
MMVETTSPPPQAENTTPPKSIMIEMIESKIFFINFSFEIIINIINKIINLMQYFVK